MGPDSSTRLAVHLMAGVSLVWLGASGCSKTHSAGDGGASPSSTTSPSRGSGGATTANKGTTGSGGATGSSGTSGTSLASVAFVPSTATVIVTGAGPQTASYVLKATLADGTVSSVVPQSIDFDRPDLASVVNGNPVIATAPSTLGIYGGVGTLHALYGGLEATATLVVQVQSVDYGAGITATSPAVAALSASSLPTDPAPTISPLLYPFDQTVWPLGLTSPPMMWNAPQAGDTYRMHVAEKYYTFDGYYPLGQLPGNLRLPQDAWDRITASNAGATSVDPVTFQLDRYDASSGKAYASASESWTIAPSSLRGSIYYWTTSNGGVLSQIPPGAGATPRPISGPNGNNCMGCHAVSADGSTLVAGVRGQSCTDNGDNRAWTSFDLPSGTVREVSTLFSGNLAINPDGKFVVGGAGPLKLSDSSNGQELPDSGLASVPLIYDGGGIGVPAFSPDGKLLAAVEHAGNDWQYWSYDQVPNTELVLLNFTESTATFSTAPVKIVDSTRFPTGQQTISYPSFSPDSHWLAFQVADHNSGCWGTSSGQCSNTTTESGAIYLQSAIPGGSPVRLSRLSDPPAPHTSEANLSLEPTFNPVARGGYFWVVFTSERSWGNDPDVQGVADNDKKRLWVSAIDANPLADGGSDPSHPAFFLEGQDTTTQNMRGFWTVSQCIASPGSGELTQGVADAGAPCVNGFDCCSGFCNQGQCIGVDQVSCSGLGGTCTTAADCCNSSAVLCAGGTCQVSLR